MMGAGLVFVGALALCNLLLLLLIARRVRQLADRQAEPTRLPWLAPGTQVPDFEAVTVGGGRLSLDNLRGRSSMVGIFSTTCDPCRVQVPLFAQHAAGDGGPEHVVAVIIGTAEQAAEFMAVLAGKTTVIREEGHGPVGTAFSARAYPSVYLLDADGKVVAGGPSVAAATDARPGALAGRR